MQNTSYQSTIAFAGMIQAASLVRELAQTGKINEPAFQASIYSIFQLDPTDVTSIYGGINGVKVGLENMVLLFGPHAKKNRPLMHYALALVHLQKKIMRSKKTFDQLAQRIHQIKKQADYFHLTHPTVIANLADAYMNTIGAFKFRIVIWGNQRSLNVPENLDKIRALLLAGVRSAVLWRQVGGSRLELIFSRAKIREMSKKILTETEK